MKTNFLAFAAAVTCRDIKFLTSVCMFNCFNGEGFTVAENFTPQCTLQVKSNKWFNFFTTAFALL